MPRLALILALFAFAGCDAQPRDPVAPPRGAWALVQLQGGAASGVTLEFVRDAADSYVAGHAGCNRYRAPIEAAEAGQLRFGPAIATKMACLDGDAMAREASFLVALATVRGYRHDAGGRLQMLDEAGSVVAVWAAAADR